MTDKNEMNDIEFMTNAESDNDSSGGDDGQREFKRIETIKNAERIKEEEAKSRAARDEREQDEETEEEEDNAGQPPRQVTLDDIKGFGTGGNAKKHEGGSFSL